MARLPKKQDFGDGFGAPTLQKQIPVKIQGFFSKTCFLLLKPALFLANETGDFSKTPAAVLVKIVVFTKIRLQSHSIRILPPSVQFFHTLT